MDEQDGSKCREVAVKELVSAINQFLLKRPEWDDSFKPFLDSYLKYREFNLRDLMWLVKDTMFNEFAGSFQTASIDLQSVLEGIGLDKGDYFTNWSHLSSSSIDPDQIEGIELVKDEETVKGIRGLCLEMNQWGGFRERLASITSGCARSGQINANEVCSAGRNN